MGLFKKVKKKVKKAAKKVAKPVAKVAKGTAKVTGKVLTSPESSALLGLAGGAFGGPAGAAIGSSLGSALTSTKNQGDSANVQGLPMPITLGLKSPEAPKVETIKPLAGNAGLPDLIGLVSELFGGRSSQGELSFESGGVSQSGGTDLTPFLLLGGAGLIVWLATR